MENRNTGNNAPGMNSHADVNADKPMYYVGMGASAGGLEALQLFFTNMPHKSGLAFVVVQHLSPDYKSLMVELLSKYTEMEVQRVEDGMRIQSDKVYLIPPKKNMTINEGNLYLTEKPERDHLNLPIDSFFCSLAEDQGEKAIGIILSGTGSDGTRGVRAIKEEGGTVIVQTEESAKFDGMPRSAVSTGLADFILPPNAMPDELLNFIHHPHIAEKKELNDVIISQEDTFTKIFRAINKKTNVDFSYYKPSTMVRRIERRMGIVQAHSFEEYLVFLHRNPKEVTNLFKDLLIGVTKFFRDQEAFRAIRERVIPEMFNNAEQKNIKSIRVWISGCSTGEEAYSMAMLLCDYMETLKTNFDVKVFATDIDRRAVEFAGLGYYPESIVADVDMTFLNRFFEKRTNGYQVHRSIREMIVFAVQNLIKDPPFTKVDLITCRNLLIYLQPILQKRVLSIFNYALIPNGFLFLGNSETIGDLNDVFHPFDNAHRIYRHPLKGAIPIKNDEIGPPPVGKNLTLNYRPVTHAKEFKVNMNQNRAAAEEHYYHSLIRVLAPAVLVINEERELIQSFGDARRYINIPEGNMSLDLITMLPRELSLAVSSSIHKAGKTKETVEYKDIRIKRGEEVESVDLTVDLIQEVKAGSAFYVLKISPYKPIMETSASEWKGGGSDEFMEQRVNSLEQEVQFTRENLQATIEELQTANEELQATNEELLAANEELQSTNEELQSLNEELNTVNAEYQMKNQELTDLNNDMNNLMESTDIGTLFLDKDYRIRKFTPAIRKAINLLDQDIGRPLSDLSVPIFGDIMEDIRRVESVLGPVEKRINHQSTFFLLRLLPFRNDKNEFDGIVINLIDISAQTEIEKELQSKKDALENILGKSPSAQLMLDENGAVVFANELAASVLGLESALSKTPGEPFSDLTFTDLDGVQVTFESGPMAAIRKTGKGINKFIMCHCCKDGKEIIFSVGGNPVFDSDNQISGAILKLEELASKHSRED